MLIPSTKESFELIRETRMLDNIAAHSVMVCTVALFITDCLNNSGASLNRDMIKAAALLHDIRKTRSIKTGEDHAATGEKLLCDRGYPEIGHIIGKHVVLDEYTNKGEPLDVEIVNYSDKRVLHDKIVSLDVRWEYILEKYGIKPAYRRKIKEVWKKIKLLEEKLFSKLPFLPEDLERAVKLEDFASEFL